MAPVWPRLIPVLAFFDHMLTLLARHSMIDITVRAAGDLHVDGHHTVEDVGIALGLALKQALADKAGIRRYGSIVLPMDETLVTAAPGCVDWRWYIWQRHIKVTLTA